jgi:long-subunit acyl-CoA synthetase (AMP-forming)
MIAAPSTRTTVHDLFFRAVHQGGGRAFIQRVGAEPITYARAARSVAMAMKRLHALGLRRGDSAVSYLEDSVAIALFDLACATMGITPVPLSDRFSVPYLRGLVRAVDARAILTAPERADAIAELALPVLSFGPTISSGPEPRRPIVSLTTDPDLSDAEAAHLVETLRVKADGRDPFMIQPTSGSTGTPKLVIRPHLGFTRYAAFLGEELPPGSGHVILAAQALTHAFGLHMFTTALSLGATLAIPSEIDTNASLRDVWRLSPTVLPMVPRVLRSFHRQYLRDLASAPARSFFPPTARVVVVAGGKPDPAMLEICLSQGVEPIELYGSSEASIVALTPRGQWRPGWSGRVVSDVDLQIADDGELLVASPGTMLGYHAAPELTSQATAPSGHYRTGDLGELAPDGYLRIRGRKSDLFNTPEGSAIYPERIESLIEQLGWVEQVMLVGDQRPYLSCLITLAIPGLEGEDPDGFLDEDRHASLYARSAADLMALNAGLERIEKLVLFALFARPFDPQTYRSVGPGKVRRDRARFEHLYKPRVARLYAEQLDIHDSPMSLREDRRYRERKELHVPSPRLHDRVACRVRCALTAASQAHSAMTRDLSLGGAFVENVVSIAPGTRVDIELAGVDEPLSATIVRVAADGAGVRFERFSDAARRQLTSLVGRET